MDARRDEVAARNNAEWCAAVWRAHGLPVEQGPGLWFCPYETPPFYPNVVTVDAGADPRAQARFIGELARRAAFDFSVKDSFACLDLAQAGLRPLFAATWLWLEPADARGDQGELAWRRVGRPDLEPWERAWRGGDAAHERIFREELVGDPRAAVLAGFDARGDIVAGATVYEAAGVIGLTNLFGPRNQAIAAARSLLRPSAIVGYEAGEDLTSAERCGFRPVGRLTVWVRGESG